MNVFGSCRENFWAQLGLSSSILILVVVLRFTVSILLYNLRLFFLLLAHHCFFILAVIHKFVTHWNKNVCINKYVCINNYFCYKAIFGVNGWFRSWSHIAYLGLEFCSLQIV